MLALAKRWWVLTVRGVAAILFGILTFISPGLSLLALVWFFGVWAIVDGVFSLGAAFGAEGAGRRWPALVFEGVVGIAAGILTFAWPAITGLVLLYVIAAWAVITGVAELVTAIRLRKEIRGEWLLGFAGVLSVAFGILLFVHPLAGALAVAFWIGAYAIVFGGSLIGLSLRLRALGRRPVTPAPDRAHVPA